MEPTELGKPPSAGSQRDAIHIAVIPMIAFEVLKPGQHVPYHGSEENIGIVDPFRTQPIQPGEPYWLCVYPNTTTPIRHEWSHPLVDKITSEVWLRNFASSISEDFDEVMRAAGGGYNSIDGCPEIGADFWDHYEKYTGKQGERSRTFLSCRC